MNYRLNYHNRLNNRNHSVSFNANDLEDAERQSRVWLVENNHWERVSLLEVSSVSYQNEYRR